MNTMVNKVIKRQTRKVNQTGKAMQEIVRFLSKHNGEYVNGNLIVVCVSDSNPRLEISSIFQAIRCLIAINAIGSLCDDGDTLAPNNKFRIVT